MNKGYELVNFCEFDKYATKSYCAIHDVDESLNLGDITKVNENNLPYFNFICGGSPCQDFSVAGKQKGARWTCQECGEQYNPITVHYNKRDYCPKCGGKNLDKTRSSLLVEWLRIIRANKPNFGLYENVKNIVGKKHKETFDLFIKELEEYGYNCYYDVLKASDYGAYTKRERCYVLIIKKDLDNGKFDFKNIPLKPHKNFYDILDNNCQEDVFLSHEQLLKTKTYGAPYSFGGYVSNDTIYNTITASYGKISGNSMKFYRNNKPSILSTLECFRVMGFNDNDYNSLLKLNLSKNNLYKQAGNSIVVNVLYEIYKEIYKTMPYLFDDLKVSSYFSGIGAFEKALDRLFEDINKGEK